MISVIVPIYNSEKYLEACLASISSQTYDDFECIMVNDGSTDHSENICKKYCERDTRFKLISQTNSGSSIARNVGLVNSSGDYVAFIDSDDYVDKDFFKKLLNALQSYKCDIVMCDLLVNGVRLHPDWSTLAMNREDVFHHYLWGGINNSVVNKIYRKDVITNIFFHAGKNLMEDASWTSRVLERSVGVVRLDMGAYNYRTNPDSQVNSILSEKKFLESNFNRIEKLSILFRNTYDKADCDKLSKDTCKILRMIMFQTSLSLLLSSSLYEEVVNLVKENYINLKKYAANRTDRRLLCDIKFDRSPYYIRRRLAVNLMLESVLCKIGLVAK